MTLDTFDRLQHRLGAPHADLPGVVAATAEKVQEQWPDHAALLDPNLHLRDRVDRSIARRAATVLGKSV